MGLRGRRMASVHDQVPNGGRVGAASPPTSYRGLSDALITSTDQPLGMERRQGGADGPGRYPHGLGDALPGRESARTGWVGVLGKDHEHALLGGVRPRRRFVHRPQDGREAHDDGHRTGNRRPPSMDQPGITFSPWHRPVGRVGQRRPGGSWPARAGPRRCNGAPQQQNRYRRATSYRRDPPQRR